MLNKSPVLELARCEWVDKRELDTQQVYSWQHVEDLVALYLNGADRDKLGSILDVCAADYLDNLGEGNQVKFKGQTKAFVRSHGFLAAILTCGHPAWEKFSIFLSFVMPKPPAPKEKDLSKCALEAVGMDKMAVADGYGAQYDLSPRSYAMQGKASR